ncbi:unnamed protein product [Caretta caretta]
MMFNFSKSTGNDSVCKTISELLVVWGIDWTAEQCRERIQWLKTEYCKVKDANSPSSCVSYEEFDQILETVVSTDPTVVHDNLLSWDGTLIVHPTRSQALSEKRQPLDEGQELTLVLRLVIEEAMLLARHILGLYLEQDAAEPASEPDFHPLEASDDESKLLTE